MYPTQTPIQLPAPQISSPATPQLTPRELDLVRAVARGLSNRQIAAEFSLSEQTVKNQLTTIYQKLHLTSRLQLAVHAMRHDLGLTGAEGCSGVLKGAEGCFSEVLRCLVRRCSPPPARCAPSHLGTLAPSHLGTLGTFEHLKAPLSTRPHPEHP